MNFQIKTAGVALCALLGLAACGGGIEGTGATAPGTMRLSITDAPACGYDNVHLTVDKVRVHRSDAAGDADAGWSEVVLVPAKRVDLLTLTNGVLEELGQTLLPAGKYSQMRLILAANGPAAPWANSVTPSGGAETALTTPSAQQSGLKLKFNVDIVAGQLNDFVIDFDACKSIVKRGNSGQYNLKPVVTVIPLVSSAGMRVQGHVDLSIANTATQVSLQFNGAPVKATVPDATGKFVLYPVPAGLYDLVVVAAGRVTTVMTGVPVDSASPTQVSSATLRITPQVAAGRAVAGTVTPATATVRALQVLSGGPTIEVAWAAVDAVSSAFSVTLPMGAPAKGVYMANPAALVFATDTAVAGKYSLEAADGGATKSLAIDATAAVPPVVFTFP